MAKMKVTGWKFFADAIDGKAIDSGRIFVELPLDESTGRAKGTATAEMRLANSEAVKRISHLPLPMECEIELVTIADGKAGFKSVVSSVRPISMSADPLQPVAKRA